MMDKRQFSILVLCLLLVAASVVYATYSANMRAKAEADARFLEQMERAGRF